MFTTPRAALPLLVILCTTSCADLPSLATPGEASPDTSIKQGADRDICAPNQTHGTDGPLVALTECGRLSYGLYAAQGERDAIHRVPDFSFAGYRGGGVALPNVGRKVRVRPGSGDDRARIQAAIDRVGNMPRNADGFRGAVVLDAGTYQVNGSLFIKKSGVVLRGAGQGKNGTVLRATSRKQHDLLVVQGSGAPREESGTRTRITDSKVPVGARSFKVKDAGRFKVGDRIGVLRTPNSRWIRDIGMGGSVGWSASEFQIWHERTITAKRGDRLTVDIPLVDAIYTRHGGGAVFRLKNLNRRVEQVGVEELRIDSEYRSASDEAHGWKAVKLVDAEDSWVRRVTAVHFGYSAVSVEGRSRFNTVEECAMLSPVSLVRGGRRYSFNVSGGTSGTLFQRCYSEESRHDFVAGSRTTGPNVWLDCVSEDSTSDDGPHHRWSTGLLLDNVKSHWLNVENRRTSGSGHGWAGAQTMFWNSVAKTIRSDAPAYAMNWVVGCMGEREQGKWAPDEPFGMWESHGRAVPTRSLYLHQLQDRLGAKAVDAITTPAQRSGRVWRQLSAWRGGRELADVWVDNGNAFCTDGVAAGSTCCADSCGTCGGKGCSQRPGGSDACCHGGVRDTHRTCDLHSAPCVMRDWDPIGR